MRTAIAGASTASAPPSTAAITPSATTGDPASVARGTAICGRAAWICTSAAAFLSLRGYLVEDINQSPQLRPCVVRVRGSLAQRAAQHQSAYSGILGAGG
jgi:hypothetical protein